MPDWVTKANITHF
jgi:hypothetical protein